MIQTVAGLIRPEDLGFCHSHEHLFLARGRPTELNEALHMDDYAKTREELQLFQDCGGKSLVDAQPLGCGRMESSLLQIAEETGLHIIASTGFHKLAFYRPEHWIHHYDEATLTDILLHELTQGMFTFTDTQEPQSYIRAKAGQIKTAIDQDRVKDPDKKWFRAAAKASLITGAPIMCHTESRQQAIELVEFYQQMGIANDKIIICHLDRALENMECDQQLAEQGIFLEYDTIGRFKYHSDEEEAQWIKRMVDSGYADSLLLGLDTTRQRFRSYGGDIGLDHISRTFLPILHNIGVSEEATFKMMVTNPAKAFSYL